MTVKPSRDYADVWYRRQAPADMPAYPELQAPVEAVTFAEKQGAMMRRHD